MIDQFLCPTVKDNPWWEVDLGTEQAIDRIVVWNRIEAGLHTRMNHFRVRVLDQSRKVVFEQVVDQGPNPSTELIPPVFVSEQKADPAGENQTVILRLPLRDAPHRVRLSVGGDLVPVDWDEKHTAGLKLADPRLRLAAAYGLNGRNDKAAEYFAHALRLDPKLGDDRQAQHRYNAACYAWPPSAEENELPPRRGESEAPSMLDWLMPN